MSSRKSFGKFEDYLTLFRSFRVFASFIFEQGVAYVPLLVIAPCFLMQIRF